MPACSTCIVFRNLKGTVCSQIQRTRSFSCSTQRKVDGMSEVAAPKNSASKPCENEDNDKVICHGAVRLEPRSDSVFLDLLCRCWSSKTLGERDWGESSSRI